MKLCPADCASLQRTIQGIWCITYRSKLSDREDIKVVTADNRCQSCKEVPDSHFKLPDKIFKCDSCEVTVTAEQRLLIGTKENHDGGCGGKWMEMPK